MSVVARAEGSEFVEVGFAAVEPVDDVVDLATSMIRVQNAEIQIMNQFLERRGYDPITPENVDNLVIAFDATPVASPVATPAGHEGH